MPAGELPVKSDRRSLTRQRRFLSPLLSFFFFLRLFLIFLRSGGLGKGKFGCFKICNGNGRDEIRSGRDAASGRTLFCGRDRCRGGARVVPLRHLRRCVPQAVRCVAARMGGDAGIGRRDRPRLAPPAVAYPPARVREERPSGAVRCGMACRGCRGGGVRDLLRRAALRPPAAGARHGALHRDHEERRPQHGLPARRDAGAAQRVVDADLSGQFQRHEPLRRAFGGRLLRRFAR